MNSAALLDLDGIRSLDYPAHHPLTLALEFNQAPPAHATGTCSDIITGWIEDQRPALAIKVILEHHQRELFTNLCAFARAAAAWLEEPERLLQAGESLFVHFAERTFGPNPSEMCQYRCCVCEGYAESERLEPMGAWLARLHQKDAYEAALYRVSAILLQKGPLEKLERWGESLPARPGARVVWTRIAYERLQRRELDAVADLVKRKLGGTAGTPLPVLSGFLGLLQQANRRAEVETWTECVLRRLRSEGKELGGYVPFELICACKWLGKDQEVEALWPLFASYTERQANFMAGKGCYGLSMDYYLQAFVLAEQAGFSELAERVAALYKAFLANSNSPPQTVTAAREELVARSRRESSAGRAAAQPQPAMSSLDFAETNHKAEALPGQEREALLCHLCYQCIQSRQWDHAIATLMKVASLPNPLNGPPYVWRTARQICVEAGHFGVLTERNLADLRAILTRLQRGEKG